MSRFFIHRPIFAWVIAILIMMAGALALSTLPLAQYPDIAPPLISVTARYPGASAKTLEDTVTQVIEQQIRGIDNLLYMYSTSDSSGSAVVNFAFEIGTDTDIAQVQVQNKVQLALPMLPEAVQRQGLSVTKSSASLFLIAGFVSEDGVMSEADVGDYIASHVKDSLARIQGVGDVSLVGAQYAMRIWLDPGKMEQYGLNPSDIIAAVRQQNNQVAGGQVGAYPARAGQEINLTLNAASRLRSAEEFENILLRVNPSGATLRLRDVARVELNSESFTCEARTLGKPAVALKFQLASGANALDTADAVKAQIAYLSEFFPPGLKVVYALDTTQFMYVSIKAVFVTLAEAVLLVFLVMYLFLQNIRATLIPSIAIPVVLLGTFGVLSVGGFSINTLTMFGMVLAIGLLVDDAIVVVENVERLMREEGLGPREAAEKSMGQITGALVGVAVVISAVFVPMAFIQGSTGVIYRQFSITIVTAMTLSVLVALVITPALCATLLSAPASAPHGSAPHGLGRAGFFFRHFNLWMERVTSGYGRRVDASLKRPARWLACFGIGLVVVLFLFVRLPKSFLPDEDQGIIFVIVQLSSGATFERTRQVLADIDDYFRANDNEAIETLFAVAGDSFFGRGENTGQIFINLKHWDTRTDDTRRVQSIINRARGALGRIPEARVIVFAPSAVLELGASSGFVFELQDRTGQGHAALMEARDMLLAKARQHPDLGYVRHAGLEDVEEYTLHVDLSKAGALDLEKGIIDDAVSAYWGSVYVNDFMDRGRTKKVYLQADAPFRMHADDFNRYYVRNATGGMVPFSSFASISASAGSPRLERYDGLASVEIQGEAAPGKSTGQAMKVMEALAAELPAGFGHAWTGLSFQEQRAGAQELVLYAVSIAVVFLCLAALYESWSIPLSVILTLPVGVLGALLGVFCMGMDNDIYFKIGLLTIVGLSAKNSILIVEF
ncbi:efflux RND transporter permease subunit, partial [Desulfosarcina sp. OttesenSCG-928-G17]|nr:efflux RND transporter permease subunit [Desulfosarcina sp. OttesenSCG-928-G17]